MRAGSTCRWCCCGGGMGGIRIRIRIMIRRRGISGCWVIALSSGVDGVNIDVNQISVDGFTTDTDLTV